MSCSDDEEYSDEEKWVCKEMVSSAKHFTTLELDGAETVDRYLSCPVCLSLLRNPTATECLHRFCEECIQMCLRMGKNECPSCRFPIKTKRSLRPDHNFRALLQSLYPDGQPEEDDEPVDLAQYRFVPLARPVRDPEDEYREAEEERERQERQERERQQQRNRSKGRSPKQPTAGASHDYGGDGGGDGGEASASAALPKRRKKPPIPRVLHDDYDDDEVAPAGYGGMPQLETAVRFTKWSCPQCTLINTASAKKCKVCEEPNPQRTSAAQAAAAAASAAGGPGMEGGEPPPRERRKKKAKAAEEGATPRSKAAVRAERHEAAQAAKARKRDQMSEWDREMMAATKRQRSQKEIDEEQKGRLARLKERGGEEHALSSAVRPEPDLDFGDDAPSIEAQLLGRKRFSLHIRSADERGVVIVWCFPTANPGNCSAWVSLAPALVVTEASARLKFKLITKNKMFGEVKCAPRPHLPPPPPPAVTRLRHRARHRPLLSLSHARSRSLWLALTRTHLIASRLFPYFPRIGTGSRGLR